MTMRVLVTGASGYIGRHLTSALTSAATDVTALSRDGSGRGLFRCRVSGRVAPLPTHLEGVTHVAHLAGRLVDDPRAGVMDYFPANVQFTDEVLQAAVDAGVSVFVHASTRLVYPRTLVRPAREDRDAGPDSAYGISKSWAEDLVRFVANDSGLNALSLRISQVTGRDHPGLGVINSFVKQARRQRQITVHGAGEAIRDVIHVDDVVSALIAALQYRGPWLAINVGGSRPITIADMARMVAACAPEYIEVRHVETDTEDTSSYALSPEQAQRVLSWTPTWTPEAIIEAIYASEEDGPC